MRLLTIFSVTLSLLSRYVVFANPQFEEYEVDANGNMIRNPNDYDDDFDDNKVENDQLSVRVFNHHPVDIDLYWEGLGSDADDVFMFEMPTGDPEGIGMNTFSGHTFYATYRGEQEKIGAIYVTAGRSSYTFSPAKKGSSPRVPAVVETSDGTVQPSFDSPVKIIGEVSTAMSAKFRCLTPYEVDYYYDDGAEGTFQGTLSLGKETTTNTYEGHVFYFTKKGRPGAEVARFDMNKNRSLYIIMDENKPPPAKDLALWKKEEAFMEEYYNRTGLLWRHYFGPNGPRGPPSLYMWPANKVPSYPCFVTYGHYLSLLNVCCLNYILHPHLQQLKYTHTHTHTHSLSLTHTLSYSTINTTQVGEVHKVSSYEGFWDCNGPAEECQSKMTVDLELEVISLTPRAFYIPNFLSDFEAEHIIELSKPQIKASEVGDIEGGGARFSDTRTSRNAWIGRSTSAPTESLYLRAADLLVLDEKMLNSNTNAEDMQVVHYVNGQRYDSHHDWGVSGYPESRLITLLLYLTDMESPEAGGETAFPKGGADGLGFKVEPRKGSAVLFYNLLEDGNGDDLALHAALPVWQGEKW